MTDSGVTVLADATQGPFDGIEDTLIGVVNRSSHALSSLALSSNTDLFGFDGDGLCAVAPQPAGCPFGPTSYEGPNTSFSNISANGSGGVVNFTQPLGSDGTAYFSLEESLSASQVFGGGPSRAEQGGAPNPSEQITPCFRGHPVNCASGQLVETVTDVAVPGRGVRLQFDRSYDSGAAGLDGSLGFGWTHSYAMSLSIDPASQDVTIHQENGSTVTFIPNGSGGYIAPPRVLATLVRNADGSYGFTRKKTNIRYDFSATGLLVDEVDRNGYATTLGYSGTQLTTITDPAGRTLTLAYTGSHIASVTDPLGRTTKYAYTPAGDLQSVTDPAGQVHGYSYDGGHRILTDTDPRSGVTTNTYDTAARVSAQKDPAGLTQTFAYAGDATSSAGGTTTITDEHGNATVETYSSLELLSVTHGAGTPQAATTSYTYDPATLGRTTITDPLGHVTTDTFDTDANPVISTDPLGHTTRYAYNGFDEPTAKTSPAGETTTLSYDGQGNLLTSTDPLGHSTTYAYATPNLPGDVTSVTDPDSRVTKFTYDGFGDLASRATSPSGTITNTTEMLYDGDGELICQAPANLVATGSHCPALNAPRAAGTSTWDYDPAGHVTTMTNPTGGVTSHTYDANGNRTKTTEPNGHATATTFDPLNRPAMVVRGAGSPAASTTTFGYDLHPGTGSCTTGVSGGTYCTTVTDPNGHTTVDYLTARNQVAVETRPGGQTTTYGFDLAGNQTSRLDAAGRTTTLTYDAGNQLTGVSHSDGTTPAVAYTYDADGRRTTMSDGTGTTLYSYDANSRFTAVTNGAGATIGYVYDGAGHVTTLTYPSDDAVTHGYDGAGRLTTVTDWDANTTTFGYDANDNPTTTRYPNGDVVTSNYDATDQMTATQVANSATTLARINYTRDPAGLLNQETDTGALSGTTNYSYDPKDQLTAAGGGNYSYDPAGRLTAQPGGTTQSYTTADQITTATTGSVTTTFGYNQVGDRTSATPSTGAATIYGYDQENRLTTINRTVPPPVVTAISPTSGPASGGTTITITGSGFTGTTAVNIGATAATTFAVTSDTSITATTPAGTGIVDVTLTTPGGTSATSPADQYTYLTSTTKPTITSVSPNYGPTTGGATVTITGNGFTGATAITFGPTAAKLTVVNPNTITAVAPKGTAKVDIRVTTPGGTSATSHADRFTYMTRPGIYTVTPNTGAAGGGNKVTVTGFNLGPNPVVRFGNQKAKVISADATTIVAQAPAGCGTVNVRVKNDNGISRIVTADQYTYQPTGRTTTSKAATSTPHAAAAAATTAVATYNYNGEGVRTAKTTGAGTGLFAWDMSVQLPRVLSDGIEQYVYGPQALPLEQVDGTGVATYFLHDQLGNSRTLLRQDGSVTGTVSFDAYGTGHGGTATSATPLLFGSGYRDFESGLDYLINRYYDAATGQFLSLDPAGLLTGAAYEYVNGDPVNWADPTGLWPHIGLGTALGAVSTVTGGVALGLALTGVGAPAAAVLEGVSLATGVAAAAVDCSHKLDVQCGIDTAAAGFGVVGVGFRGLGVLGRLGSDSAKTGELIDTVLGIQAVHLGLVGTLVGLFDDSGDNHRLAASGGAPAASIRTVRC